MINSTDNRPWPAWLSYFPPARWLAEYRAAWLLSDAVAGVTLAAYAIPVSLAYAGLAGLPPQVGIYGYLLGGLGYALLGSSRQLAIGPTSAISLMVAGTVGAMAEGGDLFTSQRTVEHCPLVYPNSPCDEGAQDEDYFQVLQEGHHASPQPHRISNMKVLGGPAPDNHTSAAQ